MSPPEDIREALAFDVYGTLVDPIRIWRQLERYVPAADAVQIAEVWRRKQLEISFRLTAMGRYEDFEWCTRRALEYAFAQAGVELDHAEQEALVAQYDDLERFPDVEPGLTRLQAAGHRMVVLSNGTPRMLAAIMGSAQLGGYFEACISVDEVRAFKPAPAIYRHAAERIGRRPGEVRLISSNPFDDIGAEAAGLKAAWVDRSGGLFEADGAPPDVVVGTLTELADVLGSERQPGRPA